MPGFSFGRIPHCAVGRAPEWQLGKSFEALSAPERVAYYRGMAAESLKLATMIEDCDQKANFLDCAARWLSLAHEVENLQQHRATFRQGLHDLQRRTH